MGISESPKFEATFLALRISIISAAFMAMAAPLSVWCRTGVRPPSISDTWHTDARALFILGMACASALLVVVRGDTLTEQTMLNLAGGLGIIVAAIPCVPKNSDGEGVKPYPADLAAMNDYALWGLAFAAIAGWLVTLLLPQVFDSKWNVTPGWRLILTSVYPLVIALGIAMMLLRGDWMREHAHAPAAFAMFLALAFVAFLRTSCGLRMLKSISDTPVNETLSSLRTTDTEVSIKPYDWIYAGVSLGMLGFVAAAFALWNSGRPGWVLGVEFGLLSLFGVFWATQTIEGWRSTKRGN